jgi:H+/Cl- antiporter ClcA
MIPVSEAHRDRDRRSALEGQLQPWRRRLVFWLGALATGALAVLFAMASDRAQHFFRATAAAYPYFAWLAPPIGFALIVWVTRRAFPGAQGSGIPQTIAALSVPPGVRRHRLLSPRIAFGKVLFTVLALACGASVGREGPTVQVGASVMHALRRWARFPAVDVDRGLILAGGAAGVAAAFNTPLAGIVFAIEELSRSFEERTSGTILTAVLLAGVAAMALAGNYSYFGTTSVSLGAPREWVVVAAAGVVGGAMGGAYARAMLVLQRRATTVIGRFGPNASVALAFACGLGVAAAGWISHGATFGTGYAEARALVQQEHAAMAGFTALKALASLLSYASGLPGGIFAPSLSIGAALGGEIQPWLPSASGAAVVVLTMGAFFAGVVQAPLTALVIVLEMTSDRGLTLPLMASIFIARAVSSLVCPEPLYRALSLPFLHAPGRRARDPAEPVADP